MPRLDIDHSGGYLCGNCILHIVPQIFNSLNMKGDYIIWRRDMFDIKTETVTGHMQATAQGKIYFPSTEIGRYIPVSLIVTDDTLKTAIDKGAIVCSRQNI